MTVKIFTLALNLFFLSRPSLASDFQDFIIFDLCQKNINCANPPAALKSALSMCEIANKASRCDDFAKSSPEFAKLVRKCDVKSYCEQNLAWQQDNQKACLRGYTNAVIDLGISVKDLALDLAHAIDSSWQKFKSDQQISVSYLKECEKSIACKKKLAKDEPTLNRLSDQELNKISAVEIFAKRKEHLSLNLSLVSSKIKSSFSDLTSAQKSHLREMGDAALAAFEKAKIKYNCYTPVAQAELVCYAIGTVFDPTMMAGYSVKVLRAARAVAEVSEATRASSAAVKIKAEAEGLEKTLQTESVISRTQFVDKYLYYAPTTPAQNKKWIQLTESSSSLEKVKFINFENAEMQNLNNLVQDKNLVTSLTNYHKEMIFNKLEVLKKEFPNMDVEVYSDYKSARFAFKGQAPPGFQERLSQIFTESNQDFKETLIKNKIIRSRDSLQPDQWIRAGSGETADQANYATRYSRQQEKNYLQNFSDPDVQIHMNTTFKEIEGLRSKIASEVKSSSPIMNGKTLDPDAFNIVKKGAGDTALIQKQLARRFGTRVDRSTVKDIQAYILKVDQFSPDLYIEKREVATLVDASYGGISADMVGMGAQNIKSTAEALAHSKNADQALKESRAAEKEVTGGFNTQKGGFQDVVAKAVGPERMKTICSGDDCVSISKTALTDTDKIKILQGLADEGYSSKFRLSFIPEGVTETAARTHLATHGESIEKLVQKNLAQDLPPEKLKGLIFGVDMQTQNMNQGRVKLLMGSSKDIQLTSAEKLKIQKSFQKAVQQMNESLQSQGERAAYQASP